jgi:hypothetical protein
MGSAHLTFELQPGEKLALVEKMAPVKLPWSNYWHGCMIQVKEVFHWMVPTSSDLRLKSIAA